jgi:AMMECR1 domain-containing protein
MANFRPEEYINFNGPEWAVLKVWLENKQETQLGMLVSDVAHDQANKIRGALGLIREILALEKAAAQAATRNNVSDPRTF